MIVSKNILKTLHKTLLSHASTTKKQLQQALEKYYQQNDPLSGFCDEIGSSKFSQRNQTTHSSNWRQPKYLHQKLKLSSLGIGTQGGQPNSETDLKMFQVITQGIKSGRVNVLDTDINFRYGKSQKTINAALNYLSKQHKISRNEIFVASKCGYIPYDIDSNLDDKAFTKILLDEGYVKPQDIVNQIHSMHPNFIEFSVEKSLYSLGLETIDLMYINNPTQSQQTVIGKTEYYLRLEKAFQCLQKLRQQSKIRYYGIASFVSFRSPPTEQGIHVQISQIIDIAQKVGGRSHGLRFFLAPVLIPTTQFNLGMPELLMKWQKNKKKAEASLFQVAQQYNVHINLCCPLFQGRVSTVPFKSDLLNKINNNSAKHLQLVRSLPKQCVTSTIFSTLSSEHLDQNLEVTKHPYLTAQQWKKVLPV